MKTDHYDILVVGAGPAGASAAAAAARRKMRVLIVERRRVVGSPVRCAEHIPAQLIGELNIGKRYIVQPIRGMKTFLLNRQIKESPTPGFVIRRDMFDQALAERACKQGADLMLSAKAVSRNGNEVMVKQKNGAHTKIIAKIIIGADGPLSSVSRWIGPANPNLIAAVQVRLPLTHKLEFSEIYFDGDIYGGYAWLFPKGSEANIGLGMKKKGNRPLQLNKTLERFISLRTREGKIKSKPLRCVSGWIPCKAVENVVRENILLVGDAAGHTHPITGAGIFPAITCGHLAGKWAARAVEANDNDLLTRYDAECKDLFGDSIQRAADRRRLMEEKWDQLNDILKYCWVAFKEYYAGT